MDRFSPAVGVPFRAVRAKFLCEERHVEGTSVELYESYVTYHLDPFFGDVDLGLIRRAPPLRDEVPGPCASTRAGTRTLSPASL